MSVVVTLEGFEKFLDVADPVRFTKEMDQALFRAAGVLRDETKKMPPVSAKRTGYAAKGIPVAPLHGGTLRQSIQTKRVGFLAVDILTGGAASRYGGYVHDGTSKMPARPFFKYMLEDFGGKEMLEVVIQSAMDRFTKP